MILVGVWRCIHFFTFEIPPYSELAYKEGLFHVTDPDLASGCRGVCYDGVIIVLAGATRDAYYFSENGGDAEALDEKLSNDVERVGVRYFPVPSSERQGRILYDTYEVVADGEVIESYADVADSWDNSNLVFGVLWFLLTFPAGLALIFCKAIVRRKTEHWYQN